MGRAAIKDQIAIRASMCARQRWLERHWRAAALQAHHGGSVEFKMATAEHFLDKYLDPVTDALSPEAAQRIVDLKPASDVTARVAELGQKSDAGVLTEEERDEYRALADAGTLVALLKAKARRVLGRGST